MGQGQGAAQVGQHGLEGQAPQGRLDGPMPIPHWMRQASALGSEPRATRGVMKVMSTCMQCLWQGVGLQDLEYPGWVQALDSLGLVDQEGGLPETRVVLRDGVADGREVPEERFATVIPPPPAR